MLKGMDENIYSKVNIIPLRTGNKIAEKWLLTNVGLRLKTQWKITFFISGLILSCDSSFFSASESKQLLFQGCFSKPQG